MKRNKLKLSKAGGSQASATLVGIMIASLISVLLTALAATLILNGRLGEKGVTTFIFIIRAISLLVGALIGGLLLRKNYLKLVGLITAGYLFLLIGMGIVFYDGGFENILLGIASSLVGGTAALLILQKPRVNRIKRRKIAI